ncbi:MAG TPA: DUF1479 family protein [Tetrasphaera sp.]|nr:DUF1479 family protein [Tetrasphaera sp.]
MAISSGTRTPASWQDSAKVREAFMSGDSPADFPEEHYEANWTGRFTLEQLNATGRRGMGLD